MELFWNTSLIQPTFSHSNQRKMLRRGIGPQRVGSHDPLIESEVARSMSELVTHVGNPALNIHQCVLSNPHHNLDGSHDYSIVGSVVSKMTYGQRIWNEMGHELGRWNMELMELVNEAFFTFWIVDVFHFCAYLSHGHSEF
jgi:hypothetical protein